ncbi:MULTISPECIES: hypothetical protein [Vibrio]|uniref:hypothetical protein n=1 Tax=Vibrio TaxID=662 RepID=UPI0008042BA2|nr:MULTISPECIES: hypothetical protein [Vibrio]ELB2956061.1 hypothetical protein [Vibrio parahaemolyticus]ANQ16044.1 hypothetical protein BA891_01850 [Vibrio natriegens]MBO0208342.1 hypothetical protein [Vibrio sp. Vb0877]MCA2419991.1 hypothetical protein [Vibrio alginolyticus]MCA2444457.1 hypothetical protein [Vibrio alginolyticus]
MINVFKNVVAGAISLIISAPLMILFDISINGVFNPDYGNWSRSFLKEELAILSSVVFFVFSIYTSMLSHEKLIKLIS